jgi:catechol 2,3-dioxygenase-like lactoylglutathione lyase family enzyme
MDNALPGSLQFHHVGCLTENMEDSLNTYVKVLGFRQASDIIAISSQQVKICFLETAPGVFLELVEPQDENAALRKILKTRNPYYHVGYRTRDLPGMVEQLQENGFYLVNRFKSEAFDNKECAFLYTKEMHLIELIEI